MIVVLANYLGVAQGRLDSLASILGACMLVGPPLVLVMLQPDLGTSLVFGGDPRPGCSSCPGRACAGWPSWPPASSRWSRSPGPTSCATTRRQRLSSFLDANPDIQGAGYQLYQAQIAVGSGGSFGKGLTNGTQNQGDFLPVQATRLRVRDPGRGARVRRRRGAVPPVRPAAVAGPRRRLAIEGSVRDAVRRRARVDDPVPARRQRRAWSSGSCRSPASRCRS